MDVVRSQVVETCQTIQSHINSWNAISASCQPSLKNLSDLSQEFKYLLKCTSCTLTRKFPDLMSQLIQIVQYAMEEDRAVLQLAWETFSTAYEKLKFACDALQNAYLENSEECEASPEFFSGSAFYPALSMALEHAEDIQVYFFDRLTQIKHCLELFDYTEESLASLKRAMSHNQLPSSLEIALSKLLYFTELEKEL